METESRELVERLLEKGVRLPAPETVTISPEVDPERISGRGVTIHAGSRISGSRTLISSGAEIGFEAPATVEQCQVGPRVCLKGGFFSGSVFLQGASCGSSSHVRSACILEEQASIAHSVGIKQTILFPHVTLGSLINFCDCLMAGGTDAKNHSEVGSSYIHFNYTPQQDKATASLIGDVPRGVMLDQSPIFLGGQGGMVGPCRIGYGVTTAAGTICRQDELRENRLIIGASRRGGNIAYSPGGYRNVKRIFSNNLIYIGNLFALAQWYRHVRNRFTGDDHPEALHEGLCLRLDEAIAERIERLSGFFDNLERYCRSGKKEPSSADAGVPEATLLEKRAEIFEVMTAYKECELLLPHRAEAFLEAFLPGGKPFVQDSGIPYLNAVKALSPPAKKRGSLWLQSIVDQLTADVFARLPELHTRKGS
jgi:UDP-N-acetylglucosamine/UDP-N-acetylgalactosamine diphosphorylase